MSFRLLGHQMISYQQGKTVSKWKALLNDVIFKE